MCFFVVVVIYKKIKINNEMTYKTQTGVIFIILLCLEKSTSQTNLWFPKTYDASIGWNQVCLGYKTILNQKNCSSCCAAALASTLSVRDCMRDGRNVLYSMMQIWDCTAQESGSKCDAGTNLKQMVISLGETQKYLVNDSCSTYQLPYEPSKERCYQVRNRELSFKNQSCGFSTTLKSSVFSNEMDVGHRGYGVNFNGIVAANSLMAEILVNGPVVVVLDVSKHDWNLFQNYSGGVFVPTLNGTADEFFRHCLMVYGWGKDNQSGREYWMVQNSWGMNWGNQGKGKIVKNFNWLENEWRGVSTQQNSCFTNYSINTSCMSRVEFDMLTMWNHEQLEYNINSVYYQSIALAMKQFLIWQFYENGKWTSVQNSGVSYFGNGEIVAITFCSSIIIIIWIYSLAWRFDFFKISQMSSSSFSYDNKSFFAIMESESKRNSDKFAKELLRMQNEQKYINF